MNTGLIIALVISAALIGIALAVGISKNKKLIAAGQIAKRDTDFADYASEFTSRVGSIEAVTYAVKSLDYSMIGANMKGNSDRQWFAFEGAGYKAELNCIAYDEPSGIAIYKFHFSQFSLRNGIPVGALSMNKLLTQIEKMFLSFDPYTGVKNYKIDFNTKHKVF